MQLIPILIEVYHDKAPALPIPVAAYGMSRHLTFIGRTMILSDWAKETNIHVNTLSDRIKHGWSVESAITTPVEVRNYDRNKRNRFRLV